MEQRESRIVLGDNLQVLPTLADEAFQMIYIDPPFNTGKKQTRRTLKTEAAVTGDRVGFGGRRYASRLLAESSYFDEFADYLAFLEPRLVEARRVLAQSGTLYFHIDYREAHYCKLLLDEIFGRENFLNEIIWAYDYGARSKKRWPAKHDTILVYAKDVGRNSFDSAEVDREPYMAPGLVTPEKAALGKLPTDVWWHTIVPTNGREKTGYPTQKPEGVIRRMVVASSCPGDMCLDFFAGSGTLGAVAAKNGRGYVLIDSSPDAVEVAARRLAAIEGAAPLVEAATGEPGRLCARPASTAPIPSSRRSAGTTTTAMTSPRARSTRASGWSTSTST
jgi:site-specific DNA-methyltransferase (adenine-specific)